MKTVLAILSVVVLTSGLSGNAMALAPFKKVWKTKYIDTHKDEKFQAVAKKAGCNVCHINDKKVKKHFQNEYGQMIAKLIEGDAKKRYKIKEEKAKVMKELEAALEKVAKAKSKGGKGPTFGELIKAGKLPVDLEAAKKKHYEDQAKAKKDGAEVK